MEIDYAKLKLTREYVQDVSKVIGKVQQVLITAQPHDWHKGLEVTKTGLRSQQPTNNERIAVDLVTGQISTGKSTWKLDGMSSLDVLNGFIEWVKSQPTSGNLALPELQSHISTYDFEQTGLIAKLNYEANTILTEIKARITLGMTSPVLLFPHHFDVSFVWFPGQPANKANEHQFTYGFSTGDEYIAEPYYYVTEYPLSEKFEKVSFKAPAYWHAEGFSGAVLKYSEVAKSTNPQELITKYFQTVLSQI